MKSWNTDQNLNWKLYEGLNEVDEWLLEETQQQLSREPERKRVRFLRPLVAAAVAAACLVGGAFGAVRSGVAEQVGDLILGRQITQEEAMGLEEIGTTAFSSVTDNGTTVTPLAAIYDGYQLYLELRIEAPDDVTFWKLTEMQQYVVNGDGAVGGAPLKDNYAGYTLEAIDETPGDNTIDLLIHYSFWEAPDKLKTYRLREIGVKDYSDPENESYTAIVSGHWDISLKQLKVVESIESDTQGAVLRRFLENPETGWTSDWEFTMGSMSVTPLTLALDYTTPSVPKEAEYYYTSRVLQEGQTFRCFDLGTVKAIMKDGTVVDAQLDNAISSRSGGEINHVCGRWSWERVIDVSQISYIEIDGQLQISAPSS